MAKALSANQVLVVGSIGCAALLAGVITAARLLRTDPPPPAPPPPPPPTTTTVQSQMRFSANYYRALVDEDRKHFAIASQADLSQPFAYSEELLAPKKLKAENDRLDTAHLHLETKVLKEWATTSDGAGFRFEHIVLAITNRTDKPIAYRIDTVVEHPERCRSKGAIAHNALALRPGETVSRTECLWRANATLTVREIEVEELPEIGYYYVSRLVPSQVLLDERTSAGHEVPHGKACQFVPWRDIQTAVDTLGTGWADVIDFYARHNCDEYSFYRGYKRWTQPGTLPAHADESPPPVKPQDARKVDPARGRE